MTVLELMSEWLDYVKPSVKQRTLSRYSEIVRCHIQPALGDINIKRLTEGSINEFFSGLHAKREDVEGRRLSANTLTQIAGVLRRALGYAVRRRLLKLNPAEGIKIKHDEKSVEAFTEKEQALIEKYVADSDEPRLYGIIIAAYTGLRVGELLALTHADIDLRSRTINVDKTLLPIKANNNAIIGTPKTRSSVRKVPFPKQLVPIFRALSANTSEYLLCTRSGRPISIGSYQRTFACMLNKLGIRHKGFHALRHTYATRMTESQIDMKTLSEILGHSSPRVTMERYVHSSERQKKIYADKLGERLKNTPICLIGVHKLTI